LSEQICSDKVCFFIILVFRIFAVAKIIQKSIKQNLFTKNKKNMKKLMKFATIAFLAIALATTISCKKDDDNKPTEPGWDTSLGRATFATDSTWTITGNGITQVWSDAVQTVDCSTKDTYDGGNSADGFNIACRSNPGYKGDFFSWRAVVEVTNICPEGWRVPTTDDFRSLHIAFGFDAEDIDLGLADEGMGWFNGDEDIRYKYLNDWGGGYYSGSVMGNGTMRAHGILSRYWSNSELNADNGVTMGFNNGDFVYLNYLDKGAGFTLRCVK
jgi:uncharacterized protein (TIGR02145 family)